MIKVKLHRLGIYVSIGGRVVNVAVKLNRAHPLGCAVRVVPRSSPSPSSTASPISIHMGDVPFGDWWAARQETESNNNNTNGIQISNSSSDSNISDGSTSSSADSQVSTVRIDSLAGILDYNQPSTSAALIKCALILLNIVTPPTLSSEHTHAARRTAGTAGGRPHLKLQQQINRYAASITSKASSSPSSPSVSSSSSPSFGFLPNDDVDDDEVDYSLELYSWCTLPNGTDLGVSSTLSACCLAALQTPLMSDPSIINTPSSSSSSSLSTSSRPSSLVSSMPPSTHASNREDILATLAYQTLQVEQMMTTGGRRVHACMYRRRAMNARACIVWDLQKCMMQQHVGED